MNLAGFSKNIPEASGAAEKRESADGRIIAKRESEFVSVQDTAPVPDALGIEGSFLVAEDFCEQGSVGFDRFDAQSEAKKIEGVWFFGGDKHRAGGDARLGKWPREKHLEALPCDRHSIRHVSILDCAVGEPDLELVFEGMRDRTKQGTGFRVVASPARNVWRCGTGDVVLGKDGRRRIPARECPAETFDSER